MYPTLFEVPSLHLTIPAYNTMIVLAVVICDAIGPRWIAALEGLDRGRALRALLLVGAAAFVGGRLHFVLVRWADFAHRPLAALEVWSGGLHAGGALVMMALTAPFLLRWLQLPLARFADGLTPITGIGIAIARLGCFLNGCCFGSICRWPWCLSFPRSSFIYDFHARLGLLPAAAARTLPVHPLQLYFAGLGLLVTAVALWLHPRRRYEGEVALVGLALYSAGAAALELFRADFRQVYWGPLPQLEWVALAMAAISLGTLAASEFEHRRGRRAG